MFIRLNSLSGLDSIAWRPRVDYSLYIDDNGIPAVGTYPEILLGVVGGPRQLLTVASEEISTARAEDKGIRCASVEPSGWTSSLPLEVI